MKLTPTEFDKLQKLRKANKGPNKPITKRHKKIKVKGINISHLAEKVKSVSYKDFLRSEYWNEIKKMVHKRDGNKCTVCGNHGEMHVHHTTYKNVRMEYKHLSDLQLLCSKCHYNIHSIMEIV